jgi:protein associated with RNAse G/E
LRINRLYFSHRVICPKHTKKGEEKMLKITVTFEMDEEQLRDLFENMDIKFTKTKGKQLQKELEYTSEDVQIALEESFEEIVTETIEELFE